VTTTGLYFGFPVVFMFAKMPERHILAPIQHNMQAIILDKLSLFTI